MSCPRVREVEKTLSPAELRAFCDHARQCVDCGPLLARVADAYRALRAETVAPLSPARRVELLARIERESAKARFELRWPLAAVAFALLAVTLFAGWPRARSDAPQLIRGRAVVGTVEIRAGDYVTTNQRATVEANARLVLGAHALEVEEKSAISFESGPELIAIRLAEGRVRFDVSPVRAGAFVVSTALARFEVIGTRFVIDAEPERVELRVDEGKVRAVPADGGETRVVTAGEQVVIERRATAREVARVEPVTPERLDMPATAREVAPVEPVTPKRRVGTRTGLGGALDTPAKAPDSVPSPASRLEEARKVVSRDAAKARDLAQGVLEEKPAPALEIDALLVLADAHRRTGEWNAAAVAYQSVAEHPNGAPYAEEALLRRAQILSSHDGADRPSRLSALAALRDAEKRFPRGTLSPERAVLEAKLHLEMHDVNAAADALERVGSDRTLAVLRARVEVAEALQATAPDRARSLVAPVLESNVSRDLISRARMITSRASGNR